MKAGWVLKAGRLYVEDVHADRPGGLRASYCYEVESARVFGSRMTVEQLSRAVENKPAGVEALEVEGVDEGGDP